MTAKEELQKSVDKMKEIESRLFGWTATRSKRTDGHGNVEDVLVGVQRMRMNTQAIMEKMK